jgi:predicted protein tyrosine phosphatase
MRFQLLDASKITEVLMFELKIASLRDALRIQPWATHTISLLDPDFLAISQIPEPNNEQQILRCSFHDIGREEFAAYYNQPKMASSQQIQDILEFTAPLESADKLLVHCHAGISRSTAVACGILCQHGLTPTEAVKYVLSIRSQAFPNQHVIKLFDELLKLDGNLVAVANPREISKLSREIMPEVKW